MPLTPCKGLVGFDRFAVWFCGCPRRHGTSGANGFQLVELQDIRIRVTQKTRDAPSPVYGSLRYRNIGSGGPLQNRGYTVDHKSRVRITRPFRRTVHEDVIPLRRGDAIQNQVQANASVVDDFQRSFSRMLGVHAKAQALIEGERPCSISYAHADVVISKNPQASGLAIIANCGAFKVPASQTAKSPK